MNLEQIENALAERIFKAEEGEINALPVYHDLRALADFVENVLGQKAFMEQVLDEVRQYGRDGKGVGDKKYTVKNSTTYSYGHIPQIKELEDKLKAVKKPIEAQIKALKEKAKQSLRDMDGNSSFVNVNTETGEVFPPAHKFSKETINRGKG